MTPVLAITWGILFAGENLTPNTSLGAGIILVSLALYQGAFKKVVLVFRWFPRKKCSHV
jgi:drug/metabolite transporter (DMT)-like permease